MLLSFSPLSVLRLTLSICLRWVFQSFGSRKLWFSKAFSLCLQHLNRFSDFASICYVNIVRTHALNMSKLVFFNICFLMKKKNTHTHNNLPWAKLSTNFCFLTQLNKLNSLLQELFIYTHFKLYKFYKL
jgi:hypothetical protein